MTQQTLGPVPRPDARWVVALRLAMGVAAGAAVVVAIRLGRADVAAAASGHTVYVCPMHPEVRAGLPGVCPVCGMDLEPILDRSSAFLSVAAARPEIGSAEAERLLSTAEVRAAARVVEPGVVEAHVYADEVAAFQSEAQATFSPAAAGVAAAEVHVVAGPEASWDESTAVVRFALGEGARLPVGAEGWVTLPARPRWGLMVPAGGVLHGAEGAFVVVLGPRGSFERRPVKVGKILNRNAYVVSGLAEHERVAITEGFLLDAERRTHAASGRGDPAP